jgi:hypothetical protein
MGSASVERVWGFLPFYGKKNKGKTNKCGFSAHTTMLQQQHAQPNKTEGKSGFAEKRGRRYAGRRGGRLASA